MTAARKKDIGVIAMKVTGRGTLLGDEAGKGGIRELVRYALSLPISVAVVGMSRLEDIRLNAAVARDFTPMTKSEMTEFSGRMSAANKAALDRFFRNHQDA